MPGVIPIHKTLHFMQQLKRKICRPAETGSSAGVCYALTSRISRFLLPAIGAGGVFLASHFSAAANSTSASNSAMSAQSLSSSNIMLSAIFAGAMSFALLSAAFMIRERNRISQQNRALRDKVAGLRANNDRLEALISTTDQRTVVWNGYDDKPTVMGTLPVSCGAPDDHGRFLAFSSWLKSDSMREFEQALTDLRQSASSFDLTLITHGGGILEVQGRTSGSHAFVRFIELGSERAALAALEGEHSKLMAVFDSIQALFENIAIPVWLKDRDGNLFWVNSAYSKAVEVESSDIAIKQNIQMLEKSELKKITDAQADKSVFHENTQAIVAGDRTPMEVVDVKTQHGSAGMAISRNELESVRNSLEKTMQSHVQTLNHLATAIAIFDKKKRLQFYNSSFKQLWELDDAFLESKPDNAEVLSQMRAGNRLPAQADWRNWQEEQLSIYRETEPREEWWYLPDSQIIRVVVNPEAQGGVTWIFENETEQLELESNYNSLVRVQGETLDHLNEAIAVFGSDGRLKLSNPTFVKFWECFGTVPTTGQHIREIVQSAEDQVTNYEHMEEIVGYITAVESAQDVCGRIELADESIHDYLLVALPDGQSMLTLIDVTAPVNFERALKERNEALEESDQLKSRFIQHVSYQLRAPLTNISGYGEMMELPIVGQLNEKQAEYLSYINTSATELRTIVDDILDLATVDAGAMDLNKHHVKVEAVINKSLEGLAGIIQDRHIQIEMRIEPDATEVMADEVRFVQILFNLLSNAVAFSPDGGKLVLATRRHKDGYDLIVADDGPGVAEDIRDKIFDRFETGSDSEARRQGAGLGLSIVKSFVELHGGSVKVTDAKFLGLEGACFICTFPEQGEPGQIAAE